MRALVLPYHKAIAYLGRGPDSCKEQGVSHKQRKYSSLRTGRKALAFRPVLAMLVAGSVLSGTASATAQTTGTFTFATETKRPDVTREARDTAPKYNPTAHVRKTTKEEAGNYKKRDILGTRYAAGEIREAVGGAGAFQPFPGPGDAAYAVMPEAERAGILAAAEEYRGYGWPSITAMTYLDFYETGSNLAFQEAYFTRLKILETLLYAEVLEGEGRFVRDIANGLWVICEQTTWAHPAHLNVEFPGAGLPSPDRPIVSLTASEVAALLASVEYFLADELDALNPVFRERMRREVNRQFLQPFLERTDYWWMAYEKPFTNNWNPWVTSNYLLCALVFSQSDEERAAHIIKAVDVLDHFLNAYPDDGGCEEGPAYWNHAGGRLLDCLNLLQSATGGLIDIFDEPLVREMGNFMWYAHIHGNWYVNFADAFARYTPKPGVLYRYGKATGSENLMAFAATWPLKPYLSSDRVEHLFLRQLPNLFVRDELLAWDRPYRPARFVVLEDLETAYVRQSTDTGEGFYLAAKGGYNAESHNHNDVGNFIVFLDGEPLLIDTGVGTYTSKTFSEQRYEIWSMQSSYHNLPDINGQAQPHMIQWKSSHFSAEEEPDHAVVRVGLETAYPEAANLERYDRTLRLDRMAEAIYLTEEVIFRDGNLVAGGNRITFHLMTHHIPSPGVTPGSIQLTHPETGVVRAALQYPPDLDVVITEIQLEDPRMSESWGDTLYRISLRTVLPSDTLQQNFSFTLARADAE